MAPARLTLAGLPPGWLAQLLGFSDLATGALAVCTAIGAALGFLLGGGVGDFLAMRYPNIARPAVNQLSLLAAAPLYICFLKALPGERPPPSAHAAPCACSSSILFFPRVLHAPEAWVITLCQGWGHIRFRLLLAAFPPSPAQWCGCGCCRPVKR